MLRFKLVILFAAIGLMFSVCVQAQTKQIRGIVLDESSKPLSYARVTVEETGYSVSTDAEGKFELVFSGIIPKRQTMIVTFLGRQTYRRVYDFNAIAQIAPIILHEHTLALEEVSVQPTVGKQSNSSLMINRDIIERYPSLSLNDLLNMLPNRRVMAPSVQEMQNLTLRGAFQSVTGGARNVDELNNAFGIALIVDDMVRSNNANMQSRNPGIYGIGRANLSVSASDYNLSGDRPISSAGYSGESAFGGIDLRQIPTENIESIEVISGVAPVRYGDISDGAVIIERQAGHTPAFFRIHSRQNATSYGLSKGMHLSPKLGSINFDVSYVNSYADNRDKLKQYNRLSSTFIWTINYGGSDKWKQTFSTTYNKVLDGVNKDADDPLSTSVSYGSWNWNASTRLSYQPNTEFIKRVGLNLGLETSHQVSYREYYYNDSYVLYTDTLYTGIAEGKYATGQYTAIDHVDGRPLNLTARLESNAVGYTGSIAHHINFGATLDYSTNRGLGRLSDPMLPLKHLGAFNERYYDFSLIKPVWNVGLYLEDRFSVSIAEKPVFVTAGVRWDIQNGHQSVSPRTNISYRLLEHLDVGLAYGMAFKAPSLAHLYPGPTFREVVLLNAYNGLVNESTSRIYVHRYDPNSDDLRAQFSQTLELTSRWHKNQHFLSFNAFYKMNRDGINTFTDDFVVQLPQYEATAVPGQKPTVTVTGMREYLMNYSQMMNTNDRDNLGFELMYRTPRIEAIFTSFNMAGGITVAATKDRYTSSMTFNPNGTNLDDIIKAYYLPINRKTYFSNGRIGTATHFPKLRLIMELTADAQFLNYTRRDISEYKPLAYLRRSLERVEVDVFDMNNSEHKFLYDHRKEEALRENEVNNLFFCNFHFNLAKEINKNLRLGFNIYNFLDYQPRIYRERSATVLAPNSSPNYGAQITYKF